MSDSKGPKVDLPEELIAELQRAVRVAKLCWVECDAPFQHTHSGGERKVACELARDHGAGVKHQATLHYKGITTTITW